MKKTYADLQNQGGRWQGNEERLGTRVVKTRRGYGRKYVKRRKWNYETSALVDVEDTLKFRISKFISKKLREKKSPYGVSKVVVVDWGCGNGTALQDLQRKFGDSVSLFGISVDSYAEWKEPGAITFLQRNAKNSWRYFKPGSVDLMYSHFGLIHFEGSPKFFLF